MLRPTKIARPLAELSDLIAVIGPIPSVSVTGITLDSRRVVAGDLYAGLAGAQHHGAAFARQAIDAGAVAVLTDRAGRELIEASIGPTESIPLVVVADPRSVLGVVSAWVYGDPAAGLIVIGVTGTDGKTTTAMYLEAALRGGGHRTGLIGTVVTRIDTQEIPAVRTTPEAPDLQALLAVMRERGVTAVAMEVSSHALALGRVDAIDFDLAIFTNLGRDHLDFHGDQEHYFRAKAQLFTADYCRAAVICVDDDWGVRLSQEARIPLQTFSVAEPGTGPGVASADWRAVDLEPDAVGWRYQLWHGADEMSAGTSVPGVFNVRNAVAATAAAIEVGCAPIAVIDAVRSYSGAPGRMQAIDLGQDFVVLVDYAHTPDAVERALMVGRQTAQRRNGRLLALLGCGGDRDRGKRPLMGACAVRLADVVVITDDNPRSEDPADIRAEIMAGVATADPNLKATVLERAGREDALREIIEMARPGDVVMALGKGHEVGQEIAGVVYPLDDRAVLAQAVAERNR